MQEKDITERALEAYNDVFSDIINVLLFSGEHIIDENELCDAGTRSVYKISGIMHGQERDVVKYWQKKQLHISMLAIENQTTMDADMPLRVISYDGASYRSQLNEKKRHNKKTEYKCKRHSGKRTKKQKRYPVITLILYFGNKPWNTAKSLYERLDIPDKLRPYVNDYKINLFDISALTEEQLQMFQSDFRFVAEYFVQKRNNNDYRPSADTVMHMEEVLNLFTALTGDSKFIEAGQAGGDNMCEILERIEEKGIQKGIARGTDEALSFVERMIREGRIKELERACLDREYYMLLKNNK